MPRPPTAKIWTSRWDQHQNLFKAHREKDLLAYLSPPDKATWKQRTSLIIFPGSPSTSEGLEVFKMNEWVNKQMSTSDISQEPRTPCSLSSFLTSSPWGGARKGGLVKNYSAQGLGVGDGVSWSLRKPATNQSRKGKKVRPQNRAHRRARMCIWGGHRKGLTRHMPKTVTLLTPTRGREDAACRREKLEDP